MMPNTLAVAAPSRTRAILKRYHLRARHSLGQNFLIDLNVLREIINAAAITKSDDVIEIGAGIGSLTEQLAKRAHRVVAFEIDRHLITVLHHTLKRYPNVKIVNQDVLKADLPQIIQDQFNAPQHGVKVAANLPYYITTPILMKLLQEPVHFSAIAVTMQHEVAQRLIAKPGNKIYGAISVAIQYLNQVKIADLIPRTAFYPSPKVTSAIVSLTPRKRHPETVFSVNRLIRFVRGCFLHRRKTFQNNLKSVFGRDYNLQIQRVLQKYRVNPRLRPENLSVSTYVTLANAFHRVKLL